MRVLITGAGGFVGSFTAAHFARNGHEVLGLDRRARPLDRRHGQLDVPMVEATVLIAATVYIVANLVADIGAILLNPRLRQG